MTNTQILNNSLTTHTKSNEDHSIELLEDIQLLEFSPLDITSPQNMMDWSTENEEETLSKPIVIYKTIKKTIETPTTTQFKRPSLDTNTPKSPISLSQFQVVICLPLSPIRKK